MDESEKLWYEQKKYLYIVIGLIVLGLFGYSMFFFFSRQPDTTGEDYSIAGHDLIIPDIDVVTLDSKSVDNIEEMEAVEGDRGGGKAEEKEKFTFEKRPYIPPFGILNTYASLVHVRDRLANMKVIGREAGADVDVYSILDVLFRRLDPRASIKDNEEQLVFLNDYIFSHPGDRIFLVNLAVGLYAESRSVYPWSLKDYSVAMVDHIFIPDSSLNPDMAGIRGSLPAGMPNLQHHIHYPLPNLLLEQAHYQQYGIAKELVTGVRNQQEAVEEVVAWFQKNFVHAAEEYGWDVYLDGGVPNQVGPAAFPKSLARLYDERVVGCHEPTIMLEGIMHTLNIPALRLDVHGHGVLYLPSLNRYVHGDHVANYGAAKKGIILMSPEEFLPLAKDSNQIFQIYLDKDVKTFNIHHRREGDMFVIDSKQIDYQTQGCKKIDESEWTALSAQLHEYNLTYNSETCEVTGSNVNIKSLQELN